MVNCLSIYLNEEVLSMSKKTSLLLSHLQNASSWVPCAELSSVLGVTERQVRNYISQINSGENIILSSSKGYRINNTSLHTELSFEKGSISPQKRRQKLLFLLISASEGIDVFDTADDFYVSVSSLENDFQQLKGLTAQFDLAIRRKKDVCFLQGTEKNKRRFLRTYLFKNNWDVFMECQEFPEQYAESFSRLRHNLKKKIQDNHLYINDYSLALLSLCIGIQVLRIFNGFAITDSANSTMIPEAYAATASHIRQYLEINYQVALTETEYCLLADSLISTTSLWDPSVITLGNLALYVEEKYLDMTQNIIQSVKSRYPTAAFEESFYVKFTIHLRNCFLRKDFDTYNVNVLNNKIKYAYPLVHDIAVYIADILEHTYDLNMTQNELAYIAFHLCTSLSSYNEHQITVTYVYSDYWGYHRKTLEQLINILGDKGVIKQAISVSDYFPAAYHSDLIVSDTDMPFSGPYIKISSLPTSKDFSSIQRNVDTLYQQKKYSFFRENFLHFFDPRCFLLYKGQDYHELLQSMCEHVMELGLTTDDFYPDVLKRESLSNTAFFEVAVPHSLSVNALHSFISIAVCTPPLPWGENQKNVKLVLLLGVQANERKAFSQIFDFLVNILSDNQNTKKLSQASDFSSFLDTINRLAQTVSFD